MFGLPRLGCYINDMELETKYGMIRVTETATGLMAERMDSGEQYFLDGRWLPNPDHTMDVNSLIQHVEDEYEFYINNFYINN
jgi:hypothetical protein